jgi:hypothetical protein
MTSFDTTELDVDRFAALFKDEMAIEVRDPQAG